MNGCILPNWGRRVDEYLFQFGVAVDTEPSW